MIIDEKVEHIVEKTLSISIAAYNVEEFLKNTLDSLVAPEIMDDIEVLIIDDGSKDNTAAIGKEFVDKYPNSFKVISKPNGGYGSTINAAIDAATGQYFKTLDGDDWYDTENLVRFVKDLKNMSADLILTPFTMVYEGTGEKQVISMERKYQEKNITFEQLPEALYSKILEYEAVVLCDLPASIRNKILKFCYDQNKRTYITPKISDIILNGTERIHLFDTPLMLSRNQGLTIEQRFVKRTMDIVFALLAIVISSPFLLVIAVAIKLYDGGPVFYKQERLTRDRETFQIIKFRSMKVDSEKQGAQLAKKDDDRITPVGKIIRRTHLDELPQIFNILKGEMSFVGPRPERQEIAEKYEEIVPEFRFRLKVKAGLTGYAQVYGKYNTTPYDKLKLDLTYIQTYSAWLDVKLMLMTFKIMFQKENTEGVDEKQTTAIKKES